MPGGSSFTTSAPQSARIPAHAGPATHMPSSTTFTPSNGPDTAPPRHRRARIVHGPKETVTDRRRHAHRTDDGYLAAVPAIVAVVLLVAAAAYWVAEWADWPWARPTLRRVDEGRAQLYAYVALSPATFIYLFVLAITSWVLRSSSERTSQALLATHSTNLHNLRADPVSVLVASAFYLSSASLARWVIPFAAVMAPVERWLGSLRAVGVFFLGHVTATIVVAFVLDRGLIAFTDSDTTRFTVDVGVSYGYYCVAAMFTYRLAGRWWWSWIWAAGLSALVIVPFVQDRTFTSFGHLVTTAIGFALYPISLSATVRA